MPLDAEGLPVEQMQHLHIFQCLKISPWPDTRYRGYAARRCKILDMSRVVTKSCLDSPWLNISPVDQASHSLGNGWHRTCTSLSRSFSSPTNQCAEVDGNMDFVMFLLSNLVRRMTTYDLWLCSVYTDAVLILHVGAQSCLLLLLFQLP